MCLSNGSTIEHYFPLFPPVSYRHNPGGSLAAVSRIQLRDAVASNSACNFIMERNVTPLTDQTASGWGSLDCRPSVLHKSNSFC
jgi:hypothetical protein